VTNLNEGAKLGKEWKDAFGYFLSSDGTRLLYTLEPDVWHWSERFGAAGTGEVLV
jgi:hypothetical protein